MAIPRDHTSTFRPAFPEVLHCYIVTLLHCYIVTLLHCYIVTLLHCYIVTLLHCYIVTLLHCYTVTLLHCYIVTLLHCYTVTGAFGEVWKARCETAVNGDDVVAVKCLKVSLFN